MEIILMDDRTIETLNDVSLTRWEWLHCMGFGKDLGDKWRVAVVNLLLEFQLRSGDVLGVHEPEGL